MSIKYATAAEAEKGATPVLSLKDYFSQQYALVIPPWQREYTWRSGQLNGEGEVYRLLEDLQEFFDNGDTEYLLGVITLANTEETIDTFPAKYIVDGQQRTVTLLIFFMCCYEYLARAGQIRIEQVELMNALKQMVGIDTKLGQTVMRVRFDQKSANSILQKIYTWMTSVEEDLIEKNKYLEVDEKYSETQINLLETREYISKMLEEKDSTKGFFVGKLPEVLNKILNSVRVIQLTLDSQNEALEVYDRMNDRGVRLNSADLIKNQLFMHIDDDDFGKVSVAWNEMTKSLLKQSVKKLKDPVFLVRSHASMIWGSTVKEKLLANKYREEYLGKHKPVDFAAQLSQYAKELENLYSDSNPFPMLHCAQYLGVVQHVPLLLAGTLIKDKQVQAHFYDQVGGRAALSALSREFPPHLETIFPAWANKIHESLDGLTIEGLNAIFDEYAFKRSEGKAATAAYKEERIRTLALEMSLWQVNIASQKRKIRASLALMSWWLDRYTGAQNAFNIGNYFSSRGPRSWDIDHVAATAWKETPLDKLQSDGIGNLVLLEPTDNRLAKNISPQGKDTEYQQSGIVLTKTLSDSPLAGGVAKKYSEVRELCELEQYHWELASWNPASVTSRQSFYEKLLQGILFRKIQLK